MPNFELLVKLERRPLLAMNVIGLQVSVPIYSGGLVDAKVEEAILLLQKTNEALEAARNQNRNLVLQAYHGVNSNQALLEAYDQEICAYQQSLDAANLVFG